MTQKLLAQLTIRLHVEPVSPPLEDRVGLDPALRQSIERVVAGHQMLDAVVRWSLTSDPPRTIQRVVVQDEYTHDVVLAWGDGLYLVYDCT